MACSASDGVAFPKGGLSGVRHLDPLRVGRGFGDIALVPVPPLVGSALGVALRRVLPLLLTPERRHVEVAPDCAHRLVAAGVDEVGAEHALAVADERVVAVPLIHPEVGVEAVGDGVPGNYPAHSRFEARDVGLRRTRGVHEGRVARVQVREVADLVEQIAATGRIETRSSRNFRHVLMWFCLIVEQLFPDNSDVGWCADANFYSIAFYSENWSTLMTPAITILSSIFRRKTSIAMFLPFLLHAHIRAQKNPCGERFFRFILFFWQQMSERTCL